MRGRASTLIPVVILSALAGCLGDDAPAGPTPAPGDPATPEPTVQTPEGPGTASAAAPPATLDIPLAYDGDTHHAWCAFAAGDGECVFVDESDTAFREILESNGRCIRLVGTVTWQAETPLSEDMWSSLWVSEDGSSWSANDTTPFDEGSGTIALDWDLSPYVGSRLMLGVAAFTTYGVDAAHIAGELSQPFRLDATLTCLAA